MEGLDITPVHENPLKSAKWKSVIFGSIYLLYIIRGEEGRWELWDENITNVEVERGWVQQIVGFDLFLLVMLPMFSVMCYFYESK